MRATILKAFGGLKMTKVHTPKETSPYDKAKRFKVEVVQTDDFFGLLQSLENDTSKCIIRGNPLPSVDRDCAFRRLDSFEDVPCGFMMLDFDGEKMEDWPDLLTEPEQAAMNLIPDDLGECDFYWSLGSSAGVKVGKYSLHIWLELKSSLTSAQVRAFTVENGFDGKIQHPIQIHYTAKPIFKNGMIDPVKRRSGIVRREGKANIDEILISHRAQEKRDKFERLKSFIPDRKVYDGPITTIEELVAHRYQHLVTSTHRGEWFCDCPMHGSESKKSLHIQPGKNAWYCHGCEKGGRGGYSLAFFLCGDSKEIAVKHLKEAK